MNWRKRVELLLNDLEGTPEFERLIEQARERQRTIMTVREWNRIRRQLKVEFERMNITRCEKCNSDFALGFAHRLKRRFLHTDSEKRFVVLLCQDCHTRIEYSGSIEMFTAITEIAESRAERINRAEVVAA
jgi:hypothetical protein